MIFEAHKTPCIDDRHYIGYSLPDFQHMWSNFLDHFTSLITPKKGGRHEGGMTLFSNQQWFSRLEAKWEKSKDFIKPPEQ